MPDIATTIIRLRELERRLPLLLTNDGVNFFQDSFRRQRLDSHSPKWPARKRNMRARDSTRAVLVDSSRLQNSIRRIRLTAFGGTIGTDVPYAAIHNQGGQVNTTQTVGSHRRREHSRTRKDRVERVASHTVASHTRRMNFTMPKRQFMGKSRGLQERWARTFRKEVKKLLS